MIKTMVFIFNFYFLKKIMLFFPNTDELKLQLKKALQYQNELKEQIKELKKSSKNNNCLFGKNQLLIFFQKFKIFKRKFFKF